MTGEVHAKPNVRRATILAEEARVAAAAGDTHTASWLEKRAFGYLCGQQHGSPDSSTASSG